MSPWSSARDALVRFTALGEKMADKAIRVLREAEELAEMARAEGQPLHGELRMGVIPTIAPFLLPAMLPRLRSEWPDLKLYLREETSNAACEALHRGQLDCVLLALPFNCGEVDSALLFDDPLYVAFPPGEAPRGALGRGGERSTKAGCCCSRTGIASRITPSPHATGPKSARTRR